MCVALCLLLTGCGGAQYSLDFPFSPGQSWVMANAQEDLTFFDTTSVQKVGCETAEEIDLHITKDAAETYWEPGSSMLNFTGSCITIVSANGGP